MSEDVPYYYVWMTDDGPKRLEDLSRAELLQVCHFLMAENNDLKSPDNQRARVLGKIEMMKRGERAAA